MVANQEPGLILRNLKPCGDRQKLIHDPHLARKTNQRTCEQPRFNEHIGG